MASHAVEFVGGPLDGHRQSFTHSPARLPRLTRLPVNPSLLGFLFGDDPQRQVRGTATSLAVYRLDRDRHGLRYQHLCSVAEEERECSGV